MLSDMITSAISIRSFESSMEHHQKNTEPHSHNLQIRTLFFTNGCLFLCAEFVYDVFMKDVSGGRTCDQIFLWE